MAEEKLADRARKFRGTFWHRDDWANTLTGDDDEFDALIQLFCRAELLRAAEIAADRHLDYEECAAKIRKQAE